MVFITKIFEVFFTFSIKELFYDLSVFDYKVNVWVSLDVTVFEHAKLAVFVKKSELEKRLDDSEIPLKIDITLYTLIKALVSVYILQQGFKHQKIVLSDVSF